MIIIITNYSLHNQQIILKKQALLYCVSLKKVVCSGTAQ